VLSHRQRIETVYRLGNSNVVISPMGDGRGAAVAAVKTNAIKNPHTKNSPAVFLRPEAHPSGGSALFLVLFLLPCGPKGLGAKGQERHRAQSPLPPFPAQRLPRQAPGAARHSPLRHGPPRWARNALCTECGMAPTKTPKKSALLRPALSL
jgi:hypothetical protein